MDISEARDTLRVFINPEILSAAGEAEAEEGCLSVPGYYDKVTRAARVRVRAQDEHGETFELNAEGLLAVCIQHEMDHLEGKVFVEYLSPLKRARLAAKVRKKQRLAG
jgi:peptide deformylase